MDDLDGLVGVWALEGFSATRAGLTTHPLGERPGGMLLYTADGWMSALLTPDPEGHAGVPDAHRAPGGTVAYAGRWESTEGGAVLHHVRFSHFGPWAGATLERAVRFRAGGLELTGRHQPRFPLAPAMAPSRSGTAPPALTPVAERPAMDDEFRRG
ncbi:lipocalin-like domain-containing protein [Streptomyces sp. NPDC006551]|uniref:lipocalin-like domain-containing protein n=1 Tax=Streptomyces sp. NPDC006551 TaxID=3157178 RepID=UPI0033B7BDF8